MEVKNIEIYLSRDKDNELCISMIEPTKYGPNDHEYHEERYGMAFLKPSMFRNITFEKGPQKYALTNIADKRIVKNYPMTISLTRHGSVKLTIPCYWCKSRLNYGLTFPVDFLKGTFAENIEDNETIQVYFTRA